MRPDFGRHDRGGGDIPGGRGAGSAARESIHTLVPPTRDEKLRAIFVYRIPGTLSGQKLETLLGLAGRLRRWECETAPEKERELEDELFGFAHYEDADSLASAIELLKTVEVPLKKQEPKAKELADEKKEDEDKDGEEAENGEVKAPEVVKVALGVSVDAMTAEYIESHKDGQSEEEAAEAEAKKEACKKALEAAVRDLFSPPQGETHGPDGDVHMSDVGAIGADGVEVLNIPLAQDDELSDIPPEMRELVASEIASFRERSIKRDMERLKREQELETQERRRNGDQERPRGTHADGGVGPTTSINNIPLGPRNGGSTAALPRGSAAAKAVEFVNGGTNGHEHQREREASVETEAGEQTVYKRDVRRKITDDDTQYKESERKWLNRERQRGAALDREKGRDRKETESMTRHREDQLERERNWDDEREVNRKNIFYYRDRAAWLRARLHDRAEEETHDATDRRMERDEQRRQAAEMETARGMADSFLAQQAEGMEREKKRAKLTPTTAAAAAPVAAPSVPQRVTISFGAAAQRAQAQRGGAVRRTMAEVEGLLDDEEQEATTKRRLVPLKLEPMLASASMTDEEVNQAVRALVQEIPTEREGLWAWPVRWECLDETIIRDKLRPFVEKKVVEYLGVQEQFLVEVVEDHLRQHGRAEALVDELQEALDEAEDLVKKLWRMVIFFTESEKRGLPA